LLQRGVQRLVHRDPVPVGDDHPLQLRQPPALCRQVEGLDVEERLLDGDGEEAAPDHLGAGLAPQ
jgi:hypothetical protein